MKKYSMTSGPKRRNKSDDEFIKAPTRDATKIEDLFWERNQRETNPRKDLSPRLGEAIILGYYRKIEMMKTISSRI